MGGGPLDPRAADAPIVGRCSRRIFLRKIAMPNSADRAGVRTRRVRLVARIWSIVIIGITLVVAVAHMVVPEPVAEDYPPIENLLPVVMVLSVLGLAIAWRWEAAGGAINVGLFIMDLGLYWIIRGKFFPLRALPMFSVVVIPGVLFLVCWWRTKSQDTVSST
jgi:hypothetical protein